MAETTKKVTVTNTAKGARGIHTTSGLVMLEAGQTAEDLEVTDAELKSAEEAGYFEFGAAPKKKAAKAEAAAEPAE